MEAHREAPRGLLVGFYEEDSIKLPTYIQSGSEQKMAKDFRLFVWYLWRELRLPEPTRIQYDIAKYLQEGPKRRYISAFRGVGKSWLTCAYVVWRLWRDPNLRVLIISANENKATENAVFIKQLIDNIDVLSPLRGGGRDSVLSFDVKPARPDPAPSVRAVGITGQITGSRADIILSDDVEIPKNSATEVQRVKLEEATKEYAAVMKPGSEVIYLGTPQSSQTIYRKLKAKGYDMRVWPSRYPFPDHMDHYEGMLAPIILEDLQKDPTLQNKCGSRCGGQPTDTQRFSHEDLLEREAEYAQSGFMLQFQLDVRLTDAERFPLKTADMIVMSLNPELAPIRLAWGASKEAVLEIENVGLDGDRFYAPIFRSDDWRDFQGSIMVIDPSGRGKDETAFVVIKMLHGMLFVTRWGGLSGGYDETTLKALANIAKQQQVNLVLHEANYGDGMFGALFAPVLNRIYPVTLEEFKVNGQKEARIIDTLEPVLNQHRLVMDRGVIEEDLETAKDKLHYSGIYQMTHLTREKGALIHDDRVDVLAMGVNYWVEKLGASPEQAERKYREKKLEEELLKHMQHATGRSYSNRRSYIKSFKRNV